MTAPLPVALLEPLVRAALVEDLGCAGDITTAAVVPAASLAEARIVARDAGVVAGLDAAALAFRLVDPRLAWRALCEDGAAVAAGQALAVVSGPARGILTGERVALNFLGHLSGVASATARLVACMAGTRARLVCTRKTTPGLRALEKHAVRSGGGFNHRFGLDDAMLIKDNHLALAGGVGPALRLARAAVGHLVKIEIEVDRLDQLAKALALGVDAVLLDNMAPAMLAEAVRLVAGRAVTEASGRVTEASVAAIAATGVDLISAGWITHSAAVLDVGLDF